MATKRATQREESSGSPKTTGSMRVYELLREMILKLELRPGAPLDEYTLANQLKVSRTPAREALIRLAAEDLVVISPNRGAHVAPLDLSRVREFYEALDLCQRAISHWAALRCTPADLREISAQMKKFEEAAADRDADRMIEANRDFHEAIGSASKNHYLEDAYSRLLTQGLRLARIAFDYEYDLDPDKPLGEHLSRVADEHAQMLKFLTEGDAQKAEKIAGAHSRLALARLTHVMGTGLALRIDIPVYSGP